MENAHHRFPKQLDEVGDADVAHFVWSVGHVYGEVERSISVMVRQRSRPMTWNVIHRGGAQRMVAHTSAHDQVLQIVRTRQVGDVDVVHGLEELLQHVNRGMVEILIQRDLQGTLKDLNKVVSGEYTHRLHDGASAHSGVVASLDHVQAVQEVLILAATAFCA